MSKLGLDSFGFYKKIQKINGSTDNTFGDLFKFN